MRCNFKILITNHKIQIVKTLSIKDAGLLNLPPIRSNWASLISHQLLLNNFSLISFSNLYLISFAGHPPTIAYGSTSFVTTAPDAITAPVPIYTPFLMIAFVPIQTQFPIFGVPFLVPRFSCPIVTPVAILQLSPNS